MAALIPRVKVGLQEIPRHMLKACPVTSNAIASCGFHSSTYFQVDHRKEKYVVKHLFHRDHEKTMQLRNSPLVDLPDYSYIDGRPTELATCQKSRQGRNYDIAEQVVQLVKEMQFAQDHLQATDQKKAEDLQLRLDSRLKPKVIDK